MDLTFDLLPPLSTHESEAHARSSTNVSSLGVYGAYGMLDLTLGVVVDWELLLFSSAIWYVSSTGLSICMCV